MAESRPWEPDRELNHELAAGIIKLRFPQVDSEVLQHLGSGWEFDAYLTRDRWVFRFPRRRETAQLFQPERIVHDLVAEVLPKGIAVPRVVMLGEPALGFPYEFAGHRLIDGITAESLRSELLPVLASDLAAALAAIHSIPAEAARKAGVRELSPEEPGQSEWLERGFETAFQLRGVDPTVDGALDWLASVRLPLPVFDGPRYLIHQDLGPDHLVADPATGRLVGILDWTDATMGDPARDIVFLVTWQGWRFARDVLQNYCGNVDVAFIDRLRFMSRLLSLMWLATAYWVGSDLTRHVEGVRNAFASELRG